jgi:hypothetical protein
MTSANSGTGSFKCRVEKVKVEMICGVKRHAKSIARKRDEQTVANSYNFI